MKKEWDQLPESTFPKLCSGIKELYIDKFDSEFVDSLMNNDEVIENEIKAAYKARIKEYVLEKSGTTSGSFRESQDKERKIHTGYGGN